MIWSSWKENLTLSVITNKKTSEENWKESSAGNSLASPGTTSNLWRELETSSPLLWLRRATNEILSMWRTCVSSPSHASTSFVRLCNVPNSASTSVVPQAASDEIDDEELPQFGAAISLLTTDQNVTRIAAVFTGIPLPCHGSIERAVNASLSYRMSEGEIDPVTNQHLGRKMLIGWQRIQKE